jgi:hypothetical protein
MSHMFRVGIQSFALTLALIVKFMNWKDEPFKHRSDFHSLFDVHPLAIHGKLFVKHVLARWDDQFLIQLADAWYTYIQVSIHFSALGLYTYPLAVGQIVTHFSFRRLILTPSKSSLQRIYKLRVLPIRQVQELLLVQLRIPRLLPYSFVPLVHPPIVQRNEPQVEHTDPPTNQDDDLSGSVSGLVLRSESLRTDDIARAVRNQVQCSDGGFLRVASNVG